MGGFGNPGGETIINNNYYDGQQQGDMQDMGGMQDMGNQGGSDPGGYANDPGGYGGGGGDPGGYGN